mgnify:FL=1
MSEEQFNPSDILARSASLLPSDPEEVKPIKVSSYDEWSADKNIENEVDRHLGYGDYLREEYVKRKAFNSGVETKIQEELGAALVQKNLLSDENAPEVQAQIDAYNRPSLEQQVRDMVAHSGLEQDDWHNGAKYLQLKDTASPEELASLEESVLASVASTRNDVMQAKLDAGEIAFGRFTDTNGNSFIKANDLVETMPLHEALRMSNKGGGDVSMLDALSINSTGLIETPEGMSVPRYKMIQLNEAESLIESEIQNDKQLQIQVAAIGKRMAEEDYSTFDHFEEGFRKYIGLPIRGVFESAIGALSGSKPDGTTTERAIDKAMSDDIDGIVMSMAKKFNKAPDDIRTALQEIAVKGAPLKVFESDEEVGKNIRDDGYGLPFIPLSVKLDDKLFERSLQARTDLSPATVKAIKADRDAAVAANFANINKTLSNSDMSKEWLDHVVAGRESKMSDTQILTSFVTAVKEEGKEPFFDAPLIGDLYLKGRDIFRPFTSAFSTVFALADADWAKSHLRNIAEDNNRRRELTELFGGELGMAQDLAKLIPEVTVDIGATALLSRFGGNALAVKAAAAKAPLYNSLTKKGLLKAFTTNAFRRGATEGAEELAENLAAQGLIKNATSRTALDALEAYNRVNLKNVTTSAIGLTAANRSASATYGTVYSQMLSSGATEQEAHDRAMGTAMVAGTGTGLITGSFSYFGRGGMENALLSGMSYRNMKTVVERVVQNADNVTIDGVSDAVFSEAIKKSGKAMMRNNFFGKSAIRAGGEEFAEEALDEFVNTFVTDAGLEQDTPLFDHAKHSLYAGTLGGILGAAAPTIGAAARRLRPDRMAETVQAGALENQLIEDITTRLRETNSEVTATVVGDILRADLDTTEDLNQRLSQEDADAEDLAAEVVPEDVSEQADEVIEAFRQASDQEIYQEVNSVIQKVNYGGGTAQTSGQTLQLEEAVVETIPETIGTSKDSGPIIVSLETGEQDFDVFSPTVPQFSGETPAVDGDVTRFDAFGRRTSVRVEKGPFERPRIVGVLTGETSSVAVTTADKSQNVSFIRRDAQLPKSGVTPSLTSFIRQAERSGALADRVPISEEDKLLAELGRIIKKSDAGKELTDEEQAFIAEYPEFEELKTRDRSEVLFTPEADTRFRRYEVYQVEETVEEAEEETDTVKIPKEGDVVFVKNPEEGFDPDEVMVGAVYEDEGYFDAIPTDDLMPNAKSVDDLRDPDSDFVSDKINTFDFDEIVPDPKKQKGKGKAKDKKAKRGGSTLVGTFKNKAAADNFAKGLTGTTSIKVVLRDEALSQEGITIGKRKLVEPIETDADAEQYSKLVSAIRKQNKKFKGYDKDNKPTATIPELTEELNVLLELNREAAGRKKELSVNDLFKSRIKEINKLNDSGVYSDTVAEIERGKALGKRLKALKKANRKQAIKKAIEESKKDGKPVYVYKGSREKVRELFEADLDKNGNVVVKKGSRPIIPVDVAGDRVFVTSSIVNGNRVFHEVGELPSDPKGAGAGFTKLENFVAFLERGPEIASTSLRSNWAGNVTEKEKEGLERIVNYGLLPTGSFSDKNGTTYGVETQRDTEAKRKGFYDRGLASVAERIYSLYPVLNVSKPFNGASVRSQNKITAYSPWEFERSGRFGNVVSRKVRRTGSLRPETDKRGVERYVAEVQPERTTSYRPLAFVDSFGEGVFDNDPISMKVLMERNIDVYIPEDFSGVLNPAFRFERLGGRRRIYDIIGVNERGELDSVKLAKEITGAINRRDFEKRIEMGKFIKESDFELDNPNGFAAGAKTTVVNLISALNDIITNANTVIETEDATGSFSVSELIDQDTTVFENAAKQLAIFDKAVDESTNDQDLLRAREERQAYLVQLERKVLIDVETRAATDKRLKEKLDTYNEATDALAAANEAARTELATDAIRLAVANAERNKEESFDVLARNAIENEAKARGNSGLITQNPKEAVNKLRSFLTGFAGTRAAELTEDNFQEASSQLLAEYSTEVKLFQIRKALDKFFDEEGNIAEGQIDRAINTFLSYVDRSAEAEGYDGLKYTDKGKVTVESKRKFAEFVLNNKIDQPVKKAGEKDNYRAVFRSFFQESIYKRNNLNNRDRLFDYKEVGRAVTDRLLKQQAGRQGLEKESGTGFGENNVDLSEIEDFVDLTGDSSPQTSMGHMPFDTEHIDNIMSGVQDAAVSVISTRPELEKALNQLLKAGPFREVPASFWKEHSVSDKWGELTSYVKRASQENNPAPIAFLRKLRNTGVELDREGNVIREDPAVETLQRAFRLFDMGGFRFGTVSGTRDQNGDALGPFTIVKNIWKGNSRDTLEFLRQNLADSVTDEDILDMHKEVLDSEKYVRWMLGEVRAVSVENDEQVDDATLIKRANNVHKLIKQHSGERSFFSASEFQNAVNRAIAIDRNTATATSFGLEVSNTSGADFARPSKVIHNAFNRVANGEGNINYPESVRNAALILSSDAAVQEAISKFDFHFYRGSGAYAGRARRIGDQIQIAMDLAAWNGRGLIENTIHEAFHGLLLAELSKPARRKTEKARQELANIKIKVRDKAKNEKRTSLKTPLKEGKGLEEFASNMMTNTQFQLDFRGMLPTLEEGMSIRDVSNIMLRIAAPESATDKDFQTAFFETLNAQNYEKSEPITPAGQRQEAVDAVPFRTKEENLSFANFQATTGADVSSIEEQKGLSPEDIVQLRQTADNLRAFVVSRKPRELNFEVAALPNGKVMAFNRDTNTLVFDPKNAAFAVRDEGLSDFQGREVIATLIRQEIGHKSAKSALTSSMISNLIDKSSNADFEKDINNYYGEETEAAKQAKARLENDDSKISAAEKETLVQERLANYVEKARFGVSSSEVEAFFMSNPSTLGTISFYLKTFINKFIRVFNDGTSGLSADERIAVKRMLVTLRSIELGYRSAPVMNPNASPKETVSQFMRTTTGVNPTEDEEAADPNKSKDVNPDEPLTLPPDVISFEEVEQDYLHNIARGGDNDSRAASIFEQQKERVTVDSFRQLAHTVTIQKLDKGSLIKGQQEYSRLKDELAKMSPTITSESTDPEAVEVEIPNPEYVEASKLFEEEKAIAQKMYGVWLDSVGTEAVVRGRGTRVVSLSDRFKFDLGTANPTPDNAALLELFAPTFNLKKDTVLDDGGILYAGFGTKRRSGDSEFDAFDFNYGDFIEQFDMPLLEVSDLEVFDKGFMGNIRKFIKTHTVGLLQPEIHHWMKHRNALSDAMSQELGIVHGKLKRLIKQVYPDGVPTEDGLSLIQIASGSTAGATISDLDQKKIDDDYNADMVAAWTQSHRSTLAKSASPAVIKRQLESDIEAAKTARDVAEADALERSRVAIRAKRDAALQKIAAKSQELYNVIGTEDGKGLRGLLDRLSAKLQEIHNESGKYKVKIDDNFGIYLTRTYDMFLDVGYADAVRKDERYQDRRDAAIKFFTETYRQGRKHDLMIIDGKTPTEADQIIDDEIKKKRIGDRALEAFISSYEKKPSADALAIDESVRSMINNLKAKKNVPKVLRDLLGERKDKDTPDAMLSSIMTVANMAANQAFLNSVAKAGLEKGWLVSAEEYNENSELYIGWQKIVNSESDKDFNPLSGLYANRDYAEAFTATFKKSGTVYASESDSILAKSLKGFQILTGLSMASKTLGSIGFYLRNGLSNALFFGPMQLGFVGGLKANKNYLTNIFGGGDALVQGELRRAWSGDKAKLDNYIAELRALRIVGDESRTKTMQQLMSGEATLDDVVGEFNKLITGTQSALKKGVEKVGLDRAPRLAAAMDSFFKIAMFENELRVLREAQAAETDAESELGRMNEQQLKKEAARKVLRTTQAYSEAPPIVKAFQRSPVGALFAPFVRFKADVIKVMYNTPKVAFEEINSENPILKKRGFQRLRGFGFTIGGLSTALPVLMRFIFGVSDDEDEAIKASGPRWARYQNPIYFRTPDGKLRTLTLTYLNPFSPVTESMTATAGEILNPDANPESALEALFNSFIFDQYLDDQIFSSAIIQAKSGVNETTGERIFVEGVDTGLAKTVKRLGFIADNAFSPRTLQKAILAHQNSDGDYTEFEYSPLGIIVQEFAPVRTRPVNPDTALKQFIFKAEQARSQIREEFKPLYRKENSISTDEVNDIYDSVYTRLEKLNSDMISKFKAYEKMGLTKGEIYRIASGGKGGGPKVGKRRAALLLQGYMERPVLSANKVAIMMAEAEEEPKMAERLRDFAEAVKTRTRFSKIDD